MFKHFIKLEWKAFSRSASFGSNLAIKIVLGFVATMYAVMFFFSGFALYMILEEAGMKPLETVNRYLVYYLAFDLIIRYFMQKIPTMNIRPLLTLPIKRDTIVHFAMGKNVVSFFNFVHAFLFVPFTITLIFNGVPVLNAIAWHLAVMALIYANSFINLLINNKDAFFYPVATLLLVCGFAQYYGYFEISSYTEGFFSLFSDTVYFFLLPIAWAALTYWLAFRHYRNHLRLDTGLAGKKELATTENLNWLEKFGSLGTFLKNDIRLIRRNKRSRTTVIMSCVFLFYGLLAVGGLEAYDNPAMKTFASIFVSGGFLFTFGQFVPSWDSSYYPLMMSQNIQYRDYLASKWWLIVLATIASTILALPYLYFGWQMYAIIVSGALYNIGVNSHLVLLGGAYVKTPIDLSSSRQVLGNKQAFNVKTLLISLPKLLVPMILFVVGNAVVGPELGFLLLFVAGVVGLAFRNVVFKRIERIYHKEKYATIAAYKETN